MNQQTQNETHASQAMKSAPGTLNPDYNSFIGMHKSVCLKSLPVAGKSRFASHLALCLPEVAALIDEGDLGILNLEVGALKLATRDAIERRDWHTVSRHFDFVADALEEAGDELRDALRISYLGNLLYGEDSLKYTRARALLPPSLAENFDEIRLHYSTLAN